MDMISYSFLQEEVEQLTRYLEKFVKNVGVDNCVLCDEGGRLITYAPAIDGLRPISYRSAVISAAINGALEYLEDFVDKGRTMYVSGKTRSVYMIKTQTSFIVFIAFSNKVPVGSVKVFGEKLVSEIEPILEKARSRQQSTPVINFEDLAI